VVVRRTPSTARLVYATRTRLPDGRRVPDVASLGVSRTLDGEIPRAGRSGRSTSTKTSTTR
jgi:hypothetical protein